jgi:4-amino-4-deoxy-L-arabinose transferase-like glycosyltransferase
MRSSVDASALRRRLTSPVVWAGAALAIAAAAFAWRWGPARDGYFDSAFYLDGARHIASGEGYVSAYTAPDHSQLDPITHWAPGTALLIAAGIRLGLAPLQAASLVLSTCYAAAVLLVFVLGVKLAGRASWLASLLTSLLFALQPSTLHWTNALLSDVPHASFLLLNVLLALRVMRAERPSLGLRIGWGLGLAAMATIRYAGMLYVPGLLLATSLGMRGRAWYARAWSLWPSVLTCVLGIGLWSVRNRRVVHEPFGVWTIQRSDVSKHLGRALHGGFAWFDEALHQARALELETPWRGLLWAAAACLLVLLVLSWRSAWRELCLVALSAASYFVSMIAIASTMLIAPLGETRFWVSLWPLTFLSCLIAVARARQRAAWLFKLGVLAAMLGCLTLFAINAYRSLPAPEQRRGLLNERWARAAALLPEPSACRLFVMDPRPFMLHRALGPTSSIPLSLAEFDAAARLYPALCVVVVDKHLRLSTSAEQRRIAQDAVVAELQAQNRLERIARGAGVTVYRQR